MQPAFTDTLRHAMVTAQSEARGLNQEFVGTEHLMLGVLGCETCEAAAAIQRNGPKVAHVRDALRHALPHGKESPVVTGDLPLSPKAQRAIQDAIVRAQSLRESKLSTRLIAQALLDDPETTIRRVLSECGADLNQLPRQLAEKPATAEA